MVSWLYKSPSDLKSTQCTPNERNDFLVSSDMGKSMLSNESIRDGDMETFNKIGKAIFQAGFAESDVWEANPSIKPVLERLKPQLDSLLSCSKLCLLSVNFNHCPELLGMGVASRVYRIEHNNQVRKIVALICQKLDPTLNHRRYSLASISGRLLNDSSLISDYGLGSIMSKWEVKMVKKSAEQMAQEIQSGESSMDELYLVSLILPDNEAFSGAVRIQRKLNSSTLVSQVMDLLCKRFPNIDPQDWMLCSTTGVALSPSKALAHYGLGSKFINMSLNVMHVVNSRRSSLTGTSVDTDLSPEYAWTQVDNQLTLQEARVIIRNLERQLSNFKSKSESDMAASHIEKENLISCIVEQRAINSELTEQFELLNDQSRKLLESYGNLKKMKVELSVRNQTLESDLTSTKHKLNLSESELVKLNNINSQLTNQMVVHNFEFEGKKLDYESKITDLEMELQRESQRTLDLYEKQIEKQEMINHFDALVVKLRTEKNNLESNLDLHIKNANKLSEQVVKLTRDNGIAFYNEQQIKNKYDFLYQENEKTKIRLGQINNQRIELQRDLESLKIYSECEIQSKTKDILLLSENNRDQMRVHEEMKLSYDQQIQGLHSTLQRAMSSQTDIEQENSKLKESALQRKSEFDMLQSKNRTLHQNIESMKSEAISTNKVLEEIKRQAGTTLEELNQARHKLEMQVTESKNLKQQIEMHKKELIVEHSGMIQAKKEKEAIGMELQIISREIGTLRDHVKSLEQVNMTLKKQHEVKLTTTSEAFNHLNSQISKLTSERTENKKTIKEQRELVSRLEAELKELDAKLQEAKQQPLTVLAPPPIPPPPPMPNGPGVVPTSSFELPTEEEISRIKETLSKIDANSFKTETKENYMTAMLMSGLEKRFKLARGDEFEYEELLSSDVCMDDYNSQTVWKDEI